MNDDCGCDGVGSTGSEPVDNLPGQPALSYRVGTHATFLSSMLARLSSIRTAATRGSAIPTEPFTGLTESHLTFMPGGEPEGAEALLDGWACVADVLTFYQERIANEAYLRTATERRSIVELARLTGYQPRPGVAASAHLAFAVQDGFDGEIPLPVKVQSLPRPGRTAQTFETTESLHARAQWNAMRARVRATGRYVRYEPQPETDARTEKGVPRPAQIFLKGMGQNVREGAVVVLAGDIYKVRQVVANFALDQTTLSLVPFDPPRLPPLAEQPIPTDDARVVKSANESTGPTWSTLEALIPPSQSVSVPAQESSLRETWGPAIDWLRKRGAGMDGLPELTPGFAGALLDLIVHEAPSLGELATQALRGLAAAPPPKAVVLRTTARPFGHNAQPMATVYHGELLRKEGLGLFHEQELNENKDVNYTDVTTTRFHELDPDGEEQENVLFLDGEFPTISNDGLVVVCAPERDKPFGPLFSYLRFVTRATVQSRSAYGLTGPATRLELSGKKGWWQPRKQPSSPDDEAKSGGAFAPIRRAMVHVGSELLELVAEPILDDVLGASVEVEGVIENLPEGRLLIVEGERTDLPGVTGIRQSELVRVARSAPQVDMAVTRGKVAPEVKSAPYTLIMFAAPLSGKYKRDTVVIRGNVAHATHGETRDEILGSGDASVPNQTFTLRQSPRTWVSAATSSGVASTLEVRADGVLWPEADSPASLGPRDEKVVTRARGEGSDEVQGGDGTRGKRFPTGVENLTAHCRVGIGAGGNVDAGSLTTLATRPMGVREVINPLRASGGADADGRDRIRARVPIGARATDRLVSVEDHADFALNFAGIQKASAHLDIDPFGRPAVKVVIAGDEDMPIDAASDLYRNLRAAFGLYGDPSTQIRLMVARAVPIVLGAKVRIDERHLWSRVEPALREALYVHLGWDAREIGEPAWLSKAMAAMQSVEGVAMVDVELFGPLHEEGESLWPPAGDASLVARVKERLAGIVQRLAEWSTKRRWGYPAEPDEILYVSRSLPTAIALSEVKR